MPNASGDDFIEDLAETLQVPPSRYEAADRSYQSVCQWLERPASTFSDINLDVYTQGSFRLGTAIKPVSGDEDYDLDVVCEFNISKTTCTQAQLHADLGQELKLYASAHGMQPPSPWERCWTLNYADEAQFHMDVLPSVPDGQRQQLIRKQASVPLDFVEKSISITDSNHPKYRMVSHEWPSSNPNGYAAWFLQRMRPVFDGRRRAIALLEKRADVADIPVYRVRTPLQSAVQILKRHRDLRFIDEPDDKPTSIVITTLAAHAYGQETTVAGALQSILRRMDNFVERRSGRWWIPNPSDPRENFADAWNEGSARQAVFEDWLETARADFSAAARQTDPSGFIETLAPRIGRELVEAAVARRGPARATPIKAGVGRAMRRLLDAPHRRPAAWPTYQTGSVEIRVATAVRDGFRPRIFASADLPIARGSTLRFDASTDVPRPFEVYWQIVNTGEAARDARDLRGGFDKGEVMPGLLSRSETAKYPGSHSIECFVIKNGLLAARSGPFLVSIS